MNLNGDDIAPEEAPSDDESRRNTDSNDAHGSVGANEPARSPRAGADSDRGEAGSDSGRGEADSDFGRGEAGALPRERTASGDEDSDKDSASGKHDPHEHTNSANHDPHEHADSANQDAHEHTSGDGEDTDEEPDYFVTLPVGPDVGLAEVVAAAQEVDHTQSAWHPGMIHSQTAEVIAATAPAASLATILEQAAQQDRSNRDQAVRIELIAACERMMAHLSGLQARFAQELIDERGDSSTTLTATHDEIAIRLATTSYAAGTIITRASALADSPLLREALDGGEVSARKIDVIAAAVSGLDQGERMIIEDYGVELAPTHTPPQLKKALEAAVLATDPSRAKERYQQEVDHRTVTFDPAPHGMSWLGLYLPAEDGLSIYNCLDSIAAKRAADDTRGIDARRADALTGIFTQILASGRLPDGTSLPAHHGQSAHIHLSITAPVLAGDEHTPALLHGYGPIGAAHARELARRAGGSNGSGRREGSPARSEAGAGPQPAALSSPTFFKHVEEPSSVPAPAAHTTSKAPSTTPTSSDEEPSVPNRLNLAGTIGAPCPVAPGVLVSLAAHPGATWSERCDLGERLPADATAEELDAVFGPARPWTDHRSRAEDLAIWDEIVKQPPHRGRSPDEPPGDGVHRYDQDREDAEWDWMCRYLPHLDPMRGLLPPPRPPDLPDGTNADDLIGWVHQRTAETHAGTGAGPCSAIESDLGLICTDAYAPSRRLRSRIVDRDQTCRFPTCRVPAWRCQLDHITPYDPDLPAWAQTVETNLHALCTHHHQVKTAGIFTVERDARTGATTWHAPTGHAYIAAPEHPDYTAIAHHLRDDHHITLCEPEPTTSLKGSLPPPALLAVGTHAAGGGVEARGGVDAAAPAPGSEQPTSPKGPSLGEIWAGEPPF